MPTAEEILAAARARAEAKKQPTTAPAPESSGTQPGTTQPLTAEDILSRARARAKASPKPTAPKPTTPTTPPAPKKDTTTEDVTDAATAAAKQITGSPTAVDSVLGANVPLTDQEQAAGVASADERARVEAARGNLLETVYNTKRTPSGDANFLADYLSTQTPTLVPADTSNRNANTVKPPDQTWGDAFSMQSFRTPEDQKSLDSLVTDEDGAKAKLMQTGEATLAPEQVRALSQLLDDPIFDGVQKWQPGAMRTIAQEYIPGITDAQANALVPLLGNLARVKAQRAQVEARTVYEGPTEYALRLLGSPGSLLPGAIEGAVTGQGAEAGAKKAVASGESFMTQGAQLGRSAGRAVGGALGDVIRPYSETAADLELGLVSGAGTALGGLAGLGADVVADPISLGPVAYRGAKGLATAAHELPIADLGRYMWTGVAPGDTVPTAIDGVWSTQRAVDAAQSAAKKVTQERSMLVQQAYEDWKALERKIPPPPADGDELALDMVNTAKEAADKAKDTYFRTKKIAADNAEGAYLRTLMEVDPQVESRVGGGPRELPQGPGIGSFAKVESPDVNVRHSAVVERATAEMRAKLAAVPKVFAKEVAASEGLAARSGMSAEDLVIRRRLAQSPEESAYRGLIQGGAVAKLNLPFNPDEPLRVASAITQSAMDIARGVDTGAVDMLGNVSFTESDISKIRAGIVRGLRDGLSTVGATRDALVAAGVLKGKDATSQARAIVMQAVTHAANLDIVADTATRISDLTAVPAYGAMSALDRLRIIRSDTGPGAGLLRSQDQRGAALELLRAAIANVEGARTGMAKLGVDARSGILHMGEVLGKDAKLFHNTAEVNARLEKITANVAKLPPVQQKIASSSITGMRQFLGIDGVLAMTTHAGELLPMHALWEVSKAGMGRLYGAGTRLMKAGMLGGAWLPNVQYHTANILTAPLIMYQQLGGKAAIFGTKESLTWLWARTRSFWTGGREIDRPLFNTPTRSWTMREIDDLITEQGISSGQSSLELATSLPGMVSTGTWGGALWKHMTSLDYNLWAQLADWCDTSWRAGVLIDALKGGRSEAEALTLARESLFDYSKVTQDERDMLGKVVWFWAFRRSNYASLAKNLLSHPERVSTLARIGTGVSPEAYQTGYMENDKNMPLWTAVNSPEFQERWALVGAAIPAVSAIEDAVDLLMLPLESVDMYKAVDALKTDASPAVAAAAPVGRAILGNTQPMITGALKIAGYDVQNARQTSHRVPVQHAAILEAVMPFMWGVLGIREVSQDYKPIRWWDAEKGQMVTVEGYKPTDVFETETNSGTAVYQMMVLAAQIAGAERASRGYPDMAGAVSTSWGGASKTKHLVPQLSPTDRVMMLFFTAPRRLRDVDPEYLQKREIRDLQEAGE